MTGIGKDLPFLFALMMLSSGSAATPWALHAGDYATAHGWGELRLETASTPEQLRFNLQTVTSDHVCSFEGLADAVTGIALPHDDHFAPGCSLQLRPTAGGVLVDPLDSQAEAACRNFCGTNGSYEGHYLAIPASCTWPALQQAKAIARAASTQALRGQSLLALTPLLGRCSPTLPLEQAVDLHATVAALHAASGNARGCRATMATYADDAELDDSEVVDGASPAWGRARLAAQAQVRQALAACSGGGPGKDPPAG